jgi:hypothetical protein
MQLRVYAGVMAGMMRVSVPMSFLALAAALLIGGGANAQSAGALPLTDMNFDMWCQQQANLPPERCDKRLPQDDARFDAYRKKIEDYEVPYLEQRDQNQHLNQVLLHNDPVDHPSEPSQTPNQNPSDSPPK